VRWNRFSALLAAVLLACQVSFLSAAAKQALAPEFTLKDLNGTPVTLSQFKGCVIFLDFWASWCPPCRGSIPAVENLYEKYKDKKVVFLGISVENDKAAIREFVSEYGMKYPVLMTNGTVERDYRIQGIPAFFIINEKGEIARRYYGYQPRMENEWQTEIDTLLPVSPAQQQKAVTPKSKPLPVK